MLLHQAIITDGSRLRRAGPAAQSRPSIVLAIITVVAVAFGMACGTAETGAPRESHFAEPRLGEGEELGTVSM